MKGISLFAKSNKGVRQPPNSNIGLKKSKKFKFGPHETLLG
jgi:hypothetical protein